MNDIFYIMCKPVHMKMKRCLLVRLKEICVLSFDKRNL